MCIRDRADSGSIEIKKIDLSKDPINAKSIIGYLPEVLHPTQI